MHRRPWPLRALPCIPMLLAAWAGAAADEPHRPGGSEATQVRPGELVPPLVAPPCRPGACPFAGRHVTLLVTDSRPIGAPVLELKDEYEAATGATLEVVRMPREDPYANFAVDMIERTARYDAAIVSAAWLGDLVEGGRVAPYDRYYRDPRFPRWDIDQVLAAPRSLLSYGGKLYMVANDHDGQVMYYRRDLLEAPRHRAAFQARFGHPLGVPKEMLAWDRASLGPGAAAALDRAPRSGP